MNSVYPVETLRRIACALTVAIVTLVAVGGCASTPLDVPRSGFFDPDTRIDTLSLLREALDHEALYTLAGGLKPMSTGIWSGSFSLGDPDLSELMAVRASLAPLRNDLWYADVQVFDNIHEGERSMHAFVAHRAALARMIERFESFWSPWGITPCTHPSEVVAVVDRMPKADRWRGYGYLFGYPADAVDFFVEAGLAAEDGREVGGGIDRQFIHIPTYAEVTGRFTYAAPLDHVRTDADEALARLAASILLSYSKHCGGLRDTEDIVAEMRRFNTYFEDETIAAAKVRDARYIR